MKSRTLPPQSTQLIEGWVTESGFPQWLSHHPAPNLSSGRDLQDHLVQCSLFTHKETELKKLLQGTWLVMLGEQRLDPRSPWNSSKAHGINAKVYNKPGRGFSSPPVLWLWIEYSWLQVDMCRFSNSSQTLGFLSVSLLKSASLGYFQPQRS